jgi:hypothetical protein
LSSIPLLESDSEIEVAGLYFHSVKEFGKELGSIVDQKFRSKNAPDWFELVREARKKESKGAIYDDPLDPRFLIKEAIIPGSPVALAIPGYNADWKELAFKLRSQFNKWSHFSVAPTITNLIVVLEILHQASKMSSMTMAKDFELAISRLRDLESGNWKPQDAQGSQAAPDPEAKSFVEEVVKKAQHSLHRPPIGSEWVGAKATRKIIISKAMRDVTENGISIKNSLGPKAEEIVTQWLRYYPMGGEAKVAPDGAVMGYRKGIPYLIGWIGVQQDEETEPVGFFLDNGYLFLGDDIRDVETGQLLSKVSKEPIDWMMKELSKTMEVDTVFNVTTYGQIVTDNSQGTPVKVLDVHKDVWFPGQLPE